MLYDVSNVNERSFSRKYVRFSSLMSGFLSEVCEKCPILDNYAASISIFFFGLFTPEDGTKITRKVGKKPPLLAE
jgi:hypothetical protein